MSNALIQKVKHRWSQTQGNGKVKAKSKPVAKAPGKVTKSQAMREHLSRHPDASPTETAELLTKQTGLNFTARDVSQMKYEMKKKTGEPKKPAKTSRKATMPAVAKETETTAMESAVDQLVAAKALAERLGGIDRAKHTLDLLAKLT